MFAKTSDRKAVVYTLRVQTPPTATRLAAAEKEALGRLVADCCHVKAAVDMGATNVELCAKT